MVVDCRTQSSRFPMETRDRLGSTSVLARAHRVTVPSRIRFCLSGLAILAGIAACTPGATPGAPTPGSSAQPSAASSAQPPAESPSAQPSSGY
jgi:hypothetical protein